MRFFFAQFFEEGYFFYQFTKLIIVLLIGFISINAERLPIKTYTVIDGLLRDTPKKIKQDSHGFIWFCTGEGVSRFDGYGFTNFTTEDGLPDRHVNDFLETKNGTVYLATDNGMVKLNPLGIRNSTNNPLFINYLPQNTKSNVINVIYETKNGTILVGTSSGLYKFDEANFTFQPLDLGKPLLNYETIPVTAILEDRNSALWIGTDDNGLRRLTSGSVEIFTKLNGLRWNFVSSIFEASDGKIWVGMAHNLLDGGLNLLLSKLDAKGSIVERNFSTKDGLPSDWVTDLYRTSDDKFWIATTSGLCLWQGENAQSVCKNYRSANGLCDKDVWTITEDKDGNLWTGSACGAKKIARYGFTSYDENDGISLLKTNSVFENTAGDFFATTAEPKGRIIYRFDGNRFLSVNPRLPTEIKSMGWGWKQTVFQDRENSWWIPTAQGVFRFPADTKFENLAKTMPQNVSPPNLTGESFRLYEDARNDVWLSTVSNNGLWRWERSANIWHDYTMQLDLLTQTATSFVEDKSGNLWIGTGADNGGELVRYRDGKFKVFTKTDDLNCGWIRDLYIDHANRLWIANTKNGLLRLDNVNTETLDLRNYSTREGLSSDAGLSITEDVFGRIYVGTSRGVDRLNAETGQIESFTTNNGLPNAESEVAFRDKQNNLWFGTSGGLAKFTPEPTRQRQLPTMLVTALRVNGEPQSVSILGETEISNFELNSEQRQVSINFIGLGTSLGEKLRYEYHLNSENWIQTDDRTVNFANLTAGDYIFEIRAMTDDRIYSLPATVSFRIAAPIWQRWWFIISVIALISLSIYAFYRNRLSGLLEIERTRTRIATDLHDDIGSNLSKISLMSEIVNLQLAEKNTESTKLLSAIAEISRQSVSSMSDIVWTIKPNHDSLQELTRRMRRHAEELFVENGVQVDFKAPDENENAKISMDIRRDFYLIFKEALNNAAKYSGCRRIEIDFCLTNKIIILQVADDGCGFNVSTPFLGNGLENMKRRAEKNGGTFTIESNKNKGTIISVQLPHK